LTGPWGFGLVGGAFTCGIASAVMGVIGLIEGIVYLTKTPEGLIVDKGFDDEPFCADQPAANQRQPPLQAEASELIHP
jgi:hypothetical protein